MSSSEVSLPAACATDQLKSCFQLQRAGRLADYRFAVPYLLATSKSYNDTTTPGHHQERQRFVVNDKTGKHEFGCRTGLLRKA